MTQGTIHCMTSTRPRKIAFLVDRANPDQVLQAMECNTLLWGGMLNPIIQVDDALKTDSSRVKAVVDAFEPDHLIAAEGADGPFRSLYDHFQHFHGLEHFHDACLRGDPYEGTSVLPLLYNLYESRIRFVEPEGRPDSLAPNRNDVQVGFWFGALRTKDTALPHGHYLKLTAGDDVEYSAEMIRRCSAARALTPITSTVTLQSSHFRGGNYILIYDDEDLNDIVSAWNIRAACGPPLIAAPFRMLPDLVKYLNDVIDRVTTLTNRYTGQKHTCYILVSPGLLEQLPEGDNALKTKADGVITMHPPDFFNLKQNTLWPLTGFWIDNQSDSDSVEITEFRSGRLRIPRVDFLSRDDYSHGTVSAHVEFLSGQGGDHCSVVIPHDVRSVGSLLTPHGNPATRIGSRISYPISPRDTELSIVVPTGKELITWWLDTHGLECEQSQAGYLAERIINMASGPSGVPGLCHRTALQVFDRLVRGRNHEGHTEPKWMHKQELVSRLGNTTLGSSPWMVNGSHAFERLVRAEALIGGFELKCKECGARNFYRAQELDEMVTCSYCLSKFAIPYTDAARNPWRFRPHGPFAVPRQAMGGFAVALTLSHLIRNSYGSAAYMTGPLISDPELNGHPFEVDALLLVRRSAHDAPCTQMFVECKHFREFEQEDIDRAAWIHQRFPEAVICMATLKDELSEEERQRLLGLLAQMNHISLRNEFFRPLLVLTGTELHSYMFNEQSWSKKGGKWAELASQDNHWDMTLARYSTATQHLYITAPAKDESPYDSIRRAIQEHDASLAATQASEGRASDDTTTK